MLTNIASRHSSKKMKKSSYFKVQNEGELFQLFSSSYPSKTKCHFPKFYLQSLSATKCRSSSTGCQKRVTNKLTNKVKSRAAFAAKNSKSKSKKKDEKKLKKKIEDKKIEKKVQFSKFPKNF